MIAVPLSTPLQIAGALLSAVELRPPGRNVVINMTAARLSTGFTDAAVIRFAARLSGRSEMTIRRLPEVDLAALRQGLDTLYERERRRLLARAAVAANDKDAAGTVVVREVLGVE